MSYQDDTWYGSGSSWLKVKNNLYFRWSVFWSKTTQFPLDFVFLSTSVRSHLGVSGPWSTGSQVRKPTKKRRESHFDHIYTLEDSLSLSMTHQIIIFRELIASPTHDYHHNCLETYGEVPLYITENGTSDRLGNTDDLARCCDQRHKIKLQIQIQIQKYKYKAHITLLKSIKCNTIKVFFGHIKIVNAA